MWKVVLLLLAVFILGPLVVRYMLKNPLDPSVDGNEVVVESQEYEVHFTRAGPLTGTYLVANAESEDWSAQPVNALLSVVPLHEASDYLRAYPDFHLYGEQSNAQIAGIARPLSIIAASRPTYGAVRGLVDLYGSRNAGHGERLCVTVSGDTLQLASVQGLEDGQDHSGVLAHLGDEAVVYAESLDVSDCAKVLAAPSR
jgi:hypothetical protein